MLSNRFRWIIPLCVVLLASMACGQISIGVITPTAPNSPSETPVAMILVPTSISITPTPVSPPSSDWDLEATDTVSEDSIPDMAYLDQDGNVWVLETDSEMPRQVTFDAKLGGEGATVEYGSLSLSSDGTLLAYSLHLGTPSANGYDITSGTWVENLATGKKIQIMDGRSAGMAWKPRTHILAYGIGVDMDYFISLPDPTLATGIRAIDLDSGKTMELVTPDRGYALSGLNWSLDGRFLAFTEVFNMEGSGLFAYYDLESQDYVAWDEPVGRVSWSPDGNLLTYARHTYAATGDERLYIRPLQGNEQLLGPDYDGLAFASQPVFSPAGDQIAYLAFLEGPMTDMATIMLLDLDGGEAKPLGQFEDVWELAWVPDGSHLVFSFGLYPSRHIIALNVSDGSQTMLAAGDQLTLAGQ